MNDRQVILMPPVFNLESRFYADTREWFVSPAVFAYILDRCRIDPTWAEREVLSYCGCGEVKIVVAVAGAL